MQLFTEKDIHAVSVGGREFIVENSRFELPDDMVESHLEAVKLHGFVPAPAEPAPAAESASVEHETTQDERRALIAELRAAGREVHHSTGLAKLQQLKSELTTAGV